MNEISAKVITHSSFNGNELITLQVRAPKFLDAEFEKHRMLSSNSSSDRAIPILKQLEAPYFLPTDIRLNQAGMQGNNPASDLEARSFRYDLMYLHRITCEVLQNHTEIHKQHLNRYLMPFMYQNKVMTGTLDQWEYFLSLRFESAADPAIFHAALCIKDAIETSKANELTEHDYHLPYVWQDEIDNYDNYTCCKLSSARCARVSYNLHNGNDPSYDKDMGLFDKLVGSDPKHATPTEHQAKPMPLNAELQTEGISHMTRDGVLYSGNFKGFIQFRKILEQNNWIVNENY